MTTTARPLPLVPVLLAALVAFAAAFGIGLATKTSTSAAPPTKAPVVALPTQVLKVAGVQASASVPALAAAPRKKHAARKQASSGG
jgi:hypothetical protein